MWAIIGNFLFCITCESDIGGCRVIFKGCAVGMLAKLWIIELLTFWKSLCINLSLFWGICKCECIPEINNKLATGHSFVSDSWIHLCIHLNTIQYNFLRILRSLLNLIIKFKNTFPSDCAFNWQHQPYVFISCIPWSNVGIEFVQF